MAEGSLMHPGHWYRGLDPLSKPQGAHRNTMLIAINATTLRTSSEEAVRSERYRCPACREEVVLKQGERVIWHFAHRAGSSCRHGEGESLRHLEMKAKIGKRLRALGLAVDYEVRLDYGKRHRVADVVVDDPHVGRYVVECQSSPLTGREYEARVRFYNEAGLSVLVLWDHARAIRRNETGPLAQRYVSTPEVGVEYKVHVGIVTAAEELGIRVHYTLAEPQAIDDDGVLRALHLLPGNMRPAGWRSTYNGEQWVDAYVPKFLREVRFTDQVPWEIRVEQTPEQLQIVRLGEAPTYQWLAAPSAVDRILLPLKPDSTPARIEPVALPLFDIGPWQPVDDPWV